MVKHRKIFIQILLRCLLVLLCCVVLAGCSDDSDDNDSASTDKLPSVIVIGHRGATGYLPEHTLAGYELAIEMGVDYIEPDLQFTSDNELVAMHDSTLTRTTNVENLFPDRDSYNVSDFTLEEIKTLTVKPTGTASTSYEGFTPADGSFKVPTFQEVIDFALEQSDLRDKRIGIYPEAKQSDPNMEDKILETLINNGYIDASDRVFIQSFSADTIKSIHDKQVSAGTDMPLIVLGYSTTNDEGVAYVGDPDNGGLTMEEIATFADGVGLMINGENYGVPITADIISQAHAAGLKVHGWTFSKSDSDEAAAEYARYLAMGMDGMFTNYPDLAVTSRDLFLSEDD